MNRCDREYVYGFLLCGSLVFSSVGSVFYVGASGIGTDEVFVCRADEKALVDYGKRRRRVRNSYWRVARRAPRAPVAGRLQMDSDWTMMVCGDSVSAPRVLSIGSQCDSENAPRSPDKVELAYDVLVGSRTVGAEWHAGAFKKIVCAAMLAQRSELNKVVMMPPMLLGQMMRSLESCEKKLW